MSKHVGNYFESPFQGKLLKEQVTISGLLIGLKGKIAGSLGSVQNSVSFP